MSTLIKQVLHKTTYHNLENLDIDFDFSNYPLDIKNIKNININIYSLGTKRNDFVFGFGIKPIIDNNILTISQKMSASMKPGIYFIRHIKVMYGIIDSKDYKEISLLPKDNFELKFFYISDKKDDIKSSTEIKRIIENISLNRHKYRDKIHQTHGSLALDKPNYLNVHIFALGCLVHSVQELEGITIYPISSKLSYENMNSIVNEHLDKKTKCSLPFREEIERDYGRSSPMFVIEFQKVNALDYNNALQYCRAKSESIFSILAYDKGQKPSLFSYVIINEESGECNYGFNFPGYKGNLVSDFSPTGTANRIDKIEPLLENDHWFKFLFKSYTNAINEENSDIKYFRLWAILELIANKEVIDNDIELKDAEKNVIKYQNGDTAKTNTKFGKVYYLIYKCNFSSTTASSQIHGREYHIVLEMSEYKDKSEDGEKLTLWEVLNALYAIRNSVAHEGEFIREKMEQGTWKEKLAAKYYNEKYHSILSGVLERMVRNLLDLKIKS